MNERAHNITVGLTILLGLAGLAGILMLFGYVPTLADRGYLVRVELPNAGGLTKGSRARLNGIDIGRVTEVRLRGDPAASVLATVKVQSPVRIPRAARIRPEMTLLGGNPVLVLDVDPRAAGQEPGHLPTDGSAVIRGESSALANAQEVFAKLREDFAEVRANVRRVGDDFHLASAQVQTLAGTWTDVGRSVRETFLPRSPQDVDSGKVTANLASLLKRVDDRVREFGQTLDTVNKIVGDPKLQEQVRQVMDHSVRLTAEATAAVKQVQQTTADAGRQLEKLANRYVALADDLSANLQAVRTLLDQAGKGDGTVARLLRDPQVYDNLNDTVRRLGQAIDEVKMLVEKLRKEGLPVKM